jgi:hypothetical protein
VTIETKQSTEAHNVYASSDCLVAPIGSICGANLEKCYKDFQNQAPMLTLKVDFKVGLKWSDKKV